MVRARPRSPCVYHITAAPTSALDSAAGGRDGRFRICFIPPETFGRMPPNQPEELQPPRDVGRFSGTSALDEPRQGTAVALEIVAHAIQPFGLRRADQLLRREGGFAGAIARQSLQCIVALARRSELESRERAARFRASGTADASPPRSRLAAGGSCRSSRPRRGARRRSLAEEPSRRGKDRRGCLDRKPTRQRAETAEHPLLVRGQQLITPGDRRIDRLLAFGQIARAGGREQDIVRRVGGADPPRSAL